MSNIKLYALFFLDRISSNRFFGVVANTIDVISWARNSLMSLSTPLNVTACESFSIMQQPPEMLLIFPTWLVTPFRPSGVKPFPINLCSNLMSIQLPQVWSERKSDDRICYALDEGWTNSAFAAHNIRWMAESKNLLCEWDTEWYACEFARHTHANTFCPIRTGRVSLSAIQI